MEDMLQYDARHKVLGSAQLIHEMFHEADGPYTGNGLCGAEDVTSAVAFRLARSKTPYDHSAQVRAWRWWLCDRSPRTGSRLAATRRRSLHWLSCPGKTCSAGDTPAVRTVTHG